MYKAQHQRTGAYRSCNRNGKGTGADGSGCGRNTEGGGGSKGEDADIPLAGYPAAGAGKGTYGQCRHAFRPLHRLDGGNSFGRRVRGDEGFLFRTLRRTERADQEAEGKSGESRGGSRGSKAVARQYDRYRQLAFRHRRRAPAQLYLFRDRQDMGI